jgi:hypothetical protein
VNPVARHSVVFSAQTTSGSWSAHLPFFSSRSLFLMAVKILSLARSTTPLDCGWYTKVKTGLVPMERQKFLKSWLSNCLLLSTVSSDGTPNRQTMFCQKNFWAVFDVICGYCPGLDPLCEVFDDDEGELEVPLSRR